jgi:hypothetical protein
MGLLVVSPSHYEGLMWMGLWFILLSTLPIIYNTYNSNNAYLPIIPMQSSLFQTSTFLVFMLSAYCVSSMLPCGRYYYEPEGGYVGNPWVKFSYQYMYLYLGWFIHHLDLLEHYGFQFIQGFRRSCLNLFLSLKRFNLRRGSFKVYKSNSIPKLRNKNYYKKP